MDSKKLENLINERINVNKRSLGKKTNTNKMLFEGRIQAYNAILKWLRKGS